MTAANPVRGEVELALPSGSVRLRPSFAALVAAEGEVGSLFTLLERAGAGDLLLGDMAALMWHCAADGQADRAAFERQLMAAGPRALLAPYRALLASIFGGG